MSATGSGSSLPATASKRHARSTGDTVQYIGCYINGSGSGAATGVCTARNSANVTRSSRRKRRQSKGGDKRGGAPKPESPPPAAFTTGGVP